MTFRTTRWSLVMRAGGAGDDGARALDELCAAYWPAVYAFYRKDGCDQDAAAELAQGLFADLLERGDLAAGDPERGRFRAFLRTCAKNFRSNEHDKERAVKRGGAVKTVPIDVEREEQRLRHEPIDRLDAAVLFDRRWAQAVIERALEGLRADEAASHRGPVFDLLRPVLEGAAPPRPWAELAEELGSTEGALKVAAHRLRGRFRDRLLKEVRDTLEEGASPDDELAELFAALQG